MCMRDVYYTKSQKIGVGYKRLSTFDFPSLSLRQQLNRESIEFGKWYTSKDTFLLSSMTVNPEYDDNTDNHSIYLKKYDVGFHIFLDRLHAFKYGNRTGKASKEYVVKVHYKDVLAVGTNNCNMKQPQICVIAKKIMIVGPAYK